MVTKVLGKTGAPIKARAMMYKLVVQAVLLYGRKIWVVTDSIRTVLEVFHHRITRRIVGMTERKGNCRGWGWTFVDVELDTTGIWPKKE